MTAPKPLPDHIECWVPSEGMDSLDLYPDLAGPGSSTYVRTDDHLADRAKLLAEIDRLKSALVSASQLFPLLVEKGSE